MNKSRRSVCVLLAAYEGGRWIGEQIDSILCQYGVDVSIIISVDESEDDTLSVCQTYATESNRVTLLESKKGAGSPAANFFRLVRESDVSIYDYVAFSDQDDYWYPNKLYAAIMRLEATGGDVYSCNVDAWYPSGQVNVLSSVGSLKLFDCWFGACGPGSTYVYSSRVGEAFGKFLKCGQQSLNEITLHDWFFYAYCRVSKFNWTVDEKPFLAYRQHHANVLGANSKLAGLKSRVSLVNSGWYNKQHKLLVAVFIERQLIDKAPDFWSFKNMFELRRNKLWSLVVWVLGRVGYFR